MSEIQLPQLGRTVRFDLNSQANASLMQVLLENGVPVASSCSGDGVCAKCRVRVTSGLENLSSELAIEVRLKARLKFDENERLSCQTKLQSGECTLETTYW